MGRPKEAEARPLDESEGADVKAFRAAFPIEKVRIECLKVAMEARTAQKPPATIINEARIFEAYVTEALEAKTPGDRKDT